jgi:hypothetical protein
MANYFEYFPKTFYKSQDLSLDAVTNITSRIDVLSGVRDNPNLWTEYSVNEGDTPEIIASRVYGDPEKHWVILVLNNIIDPQFDWPLQQSDLIKFMDKKYESNANGMMTGTRWAQQNIHSYYKIETKTNLTNGSYSIDTIEIDSTAHANIVPSSLNYILSNGTEVNVDITKSTKSFYEYENDTNDNKRIIKILKSELIPLVNQELKAVFS